jgi:hypothetical protein
MMVLEKSLSNIVLEKSLKGNNYAQKKCSQFDDSVFSRGKKNFGGVLSEDAANKERCYSGNG